MNKKLLIIFLPFVILLLSLIGWFFYESMRSPVGPPNPPFEKTAICSIQKDGDGIYTVLCNRNNNFSGPLYVAKSSENLDKYIGKKLSIQAVFLSNKSNTDSIASNTQCIQEKCQQIFKDKDEKTYGIVIESILEL